MCKKTSTPKCTNRFTWKPASTSTVTLFIDYRTWLAAGRWSNLCRGSKISWKHKLKIPKQDKNGPKKGPEGTPHPHGPRSGKTDPTTKTPKWIIKKGAKSVHYLTGQSDKCIEVKNGVLCKLQKGVQKDRPWPQRTKKPKKRKNTHFENTDSVTHMYRPYHMCVKPQKHIQNTPKTTKNDQN